MNSNKLDLQKLEKNKEFLQYEVNSWCIYRCAITYTQLFDDALVPNYKACYDDNNFMRCLLCSGFQKCIFFFYLQPGYYQADEQTAPHTFDF